MKDFDDAVRCAITTYGYTKKRILADDVVREIEAEDGEDFQKYEFVNGGIVPPGTPVGVEIGDIDEDGDTFFLYDHIVYAG